MSCRCRANDSAQENLSILDGYSRAIVGRDLAESMREGAEELVIQRA